MKTEFTQSEIEEYFENLTPAEKGCIDIKVKMSIDYVLDMHFEQYDTISLAELVNLVAEEYKESE